MDVQSLRNQDVRDYARRWFRAVELELRGAGSREAAEARAEAAVAAFVGELLAPERQRHLRLRQLTANPLLLSTLCLLHRDHSRLPEDRGAIYDRCLTVLLDTWATQGRTGAGLPVEPARLVLQPLAFAMHERGATVIAAAEAEAIVAPVLAKVPRLGGLTAPQFLARARDDCGVLAGRDLASYEFFHLSFQEYLVARSAMSR